MTPANPSLMIILCGSAVIAVPFLLSFGGSAHRWFDAHLAQWRGREAPPALENLEPGALVEQALRQVVSQMAPAAGAMSVDLQVRSAHTRRLRGEASSLVDALAMLLAAAARSAGPEGCLWVECRDIERGDAPFIAISVGSAGATFRLLPPGAAADASDERQATIELVKHLVSKNQGRVEIHPAPGGSEAVLILPAALTPSRYRPQCRKTTLRGVAAALMPQASLA